MKTKKQKTTTEAKPAPEATPTDTKPQPVPSVRALMYRISTLTKAAAKRAADNTGADRAETFGFALREIENAAALYWKHHART